MTVPTATYFKLRSIVCLPFRICGFQRPLALSFGTDRRTERRIDRESRLGMDQTHCSKFSMSTVGIVQSPSRPARRNPSKGSRKPQETIRSSRRNVPFDTRRGHRDRSQERLCGPRAASTPRTYRPRNLGLAPDTSPITNDGHRSMRLVHGRSLLLRLRGVREQQSSRRGRSGDEAEARHHRRTPVSLGHRRPSQPSIRTPPLGR